MNKFEKLYLIKEEFEKSIKENKVFSLSFSDAALVTLEKLGVFFKGSLTSFDDDDFQKYIKLKVNTNKLKIDSTSYIQESLKWMFRWYSLYCNNENKISSDEILAEDIFDLMGLAYRYEKFYIMWDLHNGKKVSYIVDKNKLIFDFFDEKVYMRHVSYDSFFRNYLLEQQIEEFMELNLKFDDFEEMMKFIQQDDFSCSFEVDFNGFDLEDYKIFSTAIAGLFAKEYLSNVNNNLYLIVPGNEGIIIKKMNEWIDIIYSNCNLAKDKIKTIIEFFTYDTDDKKSDLSLAYFIPVNDSLVVSESIFSLSKPEANALRLLKNKLPKNYSRAQNNFEEQQIHEIKNKLSNRFLIPTEINKSKKNRPGMDLIVYDAQNNYLQIIELKYKIPIESTTDIKNLDNEMLKKAYKQISESKMYVMKNIKTILAEYYGESYAGIIPEKIDFLILTNYSIGTGIGLGLELPTPILLLEHYLKLMQIGGMEEVGYALMDKDKGLDIKISKRYCRYSIMGKKILMPEFYFEL